MFIYHFLLRIPNTHLHAVFDQVGVGCWLSWPGSGGRCDCSSAMRSHVPLAPACLVLQKMLGEFSGRWLHYYQVAVCTGRSYQSNTARDRGVTPLPLLPVPESPLVLTKRCVDKSEANFSHSNIQLYHNKGLFIYVCRYVCNHLCLSQKLTSIFSLILFVTASFRLP